MSHHTPMHNRQESEQESSEQDLFSLFSHQAEYNTNIHENRSEKHKKLREMDIQILQGWLRLSDYVMKFVS